MSKKLAVFDLDGTLFRWQLYHELVFALKDRGVFSEEIAAELDTSLIEWQAKKRSWHDYEMAVISAMEPVLTDLDTSVFDEAAKQVVETRGHKIYNYTKQLLDQCRNDDYYTLAISGSQQEIAEVFAQQYGFDDCIGALYERSDSKFTGNITRFVPGRKHEIIADYLAEHPDLTLDDSIAIGDSDGDISMLQMVANPIAFNPSQELLDVARANSWRIVLERKNIAYTLENDNGTLVLAQTDVY